MSDSKHTHPNQPDRGHGCDGFSIVVDRKSHIWQEPSITGEQLKRLAVVDPATYCAWLRVPGCDDLEIANDDRVDLREKGTEVFFTGKACTTEGES